MKSSSNIYSPQIDHLRCFAALMVFSWHFMHFNNGFPVKFGSNFLPFFSFFDEGHTGVSLFMVVSGYLFAKLVGSKKIILRNFYFNRALRMLPLLIFVVVLNYFISVLNGGGSLYKSCLMFFRGFIGSGWPNGGWSVSVELHFYLALPFLLIFIRKYQWYSVLGFLIISCLLRSFFFFGVFSDFYKAPLFNYAYFTIVGRFDQFIFGIIAFYNSRLIVNHKLVFFLIFLIFPLLFSAFDFFGGNHFHERHEWLWIFWLSLEGLFWSVFVSLYDNLKMNPNSIISVFFSKMGEVSYSVYLLHYFFVFHLARFFHQNIFPISNFYVCLAVSSFFYFGLYPLWYLSFRFIETPFLKFRMKYLA